MNIGVFLTLLMVVSVFTSLFTEAVKIVLDSLGKKFPSSNVLAGIVSIVLSVLVCVGYAVLYDVPHTDANAVYCVALVLLGWLSAMVGYDKVIQAITQIRKV